MQFRRFACVVGLAAFSLAAACSSSSVSPGASHKGGSSGGAGNGATGGGTGGGTSTAGGGTGGTTVGGTGGGSGLGGTGGTTPLPGTDALAGGDTAGDTSSADTGPAAVVRRRGKSAGCGMPGGMAGGQTITIPKCTGCTAAAGDCPRDCIAPEFAPRMGGNVDFTSRTFSIQLPNGYEPNTAYPIFMGGAGCGGGGGGYQPPGSNGIRINLAIKNGGGFDGSCFADGGQACSGNTTTLSYCVNSPEVPYVRAVMSWVESHYCVDLDKEFIGGTSSGSWEAYTVGCGNADQLRGFVAIAGGKRENRWKCAGPIAAFMIADKGDGDNPITTKSVEPHLDSHGSGAARDELLIRNGCQGNASEPLSAQYPLCRRYTGCPAAYPVVWCELSGGHTQTTEGGTNYANAIWPFFMSLPPSP